MSALASLSHALAALAADASSRVIAVCSPASSRTISGFLWQGRYAVTAEEALEADDEAVVITPAGTSVAARVAGRDPSTDIALLELETGDTDGWSLAPPPAVGSLAMLVGRSEESLLSQLGLISEAGPAWRSMRGGLIDARIALDLRLAPRAEGGPVIAPDGTLIGMAAAGARRQTLVIPATTIVRVVATLSERGYVPRGWLGVSLHPVGERGGAIVVGIAPDSPAVKGGLLIGDIITTWDGMLIGSVGEVADRLSAGKTGQTAKLGVLRGGNALELDVTIGERPRG